MKLINSDELKGISISASIYDQVKTMIDNGDVENGFGEVETLETCVDGDGDICVDEDAYNAIVEKLGL